MLNYSTIRALARQSNQLVTPSVRPPSTIQQLYRNFASLQVLSANNWHEKCETEELLRIKTVPSRLSNRSTAGQVSNLAVDKRISKPLKAEN